MKRKLWLVLLLCVVVLMIIGCAGKTSPFDNNGIVITGEEIQARKEKPPIKSGSLEISLLLTTYLSRSYSTRNYSSFSPIMTIGFFVFPYVEVEGSVKSWNNESLLSLGDDKSYMGKISLNYVGKRIGGIHAVPYAFAGFGITLGGPITQDAYGLRTFGAGLKTFLVRHVAGRIEYSYTAYPSGFGLSAPFDSDFWGGGWQSDQTLSTGLSFFPF